MAFNLTLKQRVLNGLTEDVVNVLYLTIFFGVFTVARRLTLAHFGIHTDDYFIALIKALVVARAIRLGAFLRISSKFDSKPLIVPVLYKVMLFLILVVLFDTVEGFIKGVINTQSVALAIDELIHNHFSKFWLGGLLMVILSFVPFFMLKELSRVMGNAKFRDLFLKTK